MKKTINKIIRKITGKKVKALISFSGGLDSLLAIKILENQGIECTAVTFETPFFSAKNSKKHSKTYGIDLRTINFSERHFGIVKNPPNGHGKNMNPCIDCHGLMFTELLKIAEKEGYDIVASGEVLGQRPMSQSKTSLVKVKKITGKDILRPLCALNMDETSYEKEGLVDRSKLYGISGRSRSEQLKLVEKFGLTDFESPGGGCVLTTIEYSNKLREYVKIFGKEANFLDAIFLRLGREKFFKDKDGEKNLFGVMGRNKEDNQKIFDNFIKSNKDYILINMKNFSGPAVIINTFGNELSENIKDQISEWFKEKVKKARDESGDNKIELKISQFIEQKN